MRCVGSSPAAAARALRTRAALDVDDQEAELIAARTLDDEEVAEDDLEPGAAIDDPRLAALIAQADALAASPARDPKFALLKAVLGDLLEGGFAPVVFCRYIATAEAVGAALAPRFQAAHGRGRDRRAAARGARDAGRGAGRRGKAPAGRDRLPVRGHQPPGLLRRGRPLRPVLEPDPPPAARGPGRPLRAEEPHRPHAPSLRREQPGRRRRARGDPPEGARDRAADRRARADARRGRQPDQGADVGGAAARARAAPVHPRPRRHGDTGRQGHRDRLAERLRAREGIPHHLRPKEPQA